MAFRKLPNRNDVLQWSPAHLADYFRMLDWKDCEKVIRKNNINGQRFLNMSENDIQRFPTLRVPQIHQLCQEINKREEKKGFFPKRNQNPVIQDSSDYRHNEDLGWDSDEFTEDEDDYEDPDQDVGSEDDGGDYESPNEDGDGHNSDNDYEPPPSNDEEAHQTKIFAAKPISNDSDYADKRTTQNSGSHPPIPPQRPGSVPILPAGNKGNVPSMFSNLSVNDDPGHNKDRGFSTPGYRAPKVDRSRKPALDQPGTQQSERDSPSMVKKSPFPDKLSMGPPRPPFGSRPDPVCRMPKPTIQVDRGNASLGRRQTSPRPCIPDRMLEDEDDSFSSRSFPRPVDSALNANTFPYRSSRPGPKPSFPGGNQMPLSNTDSLSPSGSLPPRFQQEAKQSFSRGPSDSRPPHPLPINKARPAPAAPQEECLSREWYAGCISRLDAESALRNINEDGTFLVRNSSRRNSEHPFVLMVLYGDKVYNIQIRYQEDIAMYLLGTGLRGKENFSSVTELVEYHTQKPLMLIDGKDQRGGQRNQCTLIYPAAQ